MTEQPLWEQLETSLHAHYRNRITGEVLVGMHCLEGLNVLESRLAAAEAERDSIQHQEIAAAQVELNAMRDRALAAEAATKERQEYADTAVGLAQQQKTRAEAAEAALSEARAALEDISRYHLDGGAKHNWKSAQDIALAALSRPASAISPRAKLQDPAETFVTGFTGPRTAARPATETTEAQTKLDNSKGDTV